MEEQAKKNNFNRVTKVWLEIGEEAFVEPESIRFCFDVVMKGSMAENAGLEIVRTPGSRDIGVKELEVE